MKSEQCTSAAMQAHRAQKSKGMSPKGKDAMRKQAHKSDGSMGMMDKSQEQVNGYKMGQGDGRGNY